MLLSPLHRTRVPVLCLILICVASVGLASLFTQAQFVGVTAASIASDRPNYVAATAPATKGVVPTPAGNTITVNSTADVVNSSDGLCTLREAITAANTNTASGVTAGECAAGGSGSD